MGASLPHLGYDKLGETDEICSMDMILTIYILSNRGDPYSTQGDIIDHGRGMASGENSTYDGDLNAWKCKNF